MRERNDTISHLTSTIRISSSTPLKHPAYKAVTGGTRPTEPVDELISKVAHAPTKKVKVVHCRCNEER